MTCHVISADWVLKCFVHLTICHIITLAKTKAVTDQKILGFLSICEEGREKSAGLALFSCNQLR